MEHLSWAPLLGVHLLSKHPSFRLQVAYRGRERRALRSDGGQPRTQELRRPRGGAHAVRLYVRARPMCSAARVAIAMMVICGLTAGDEGITLPSAM